MHKIIDTIINICPSCGEKVEFTSEQLQEYDGHHLEIECPHCHKFCCFVCEYVYSYMKIEDLK